MAVLLCRLRSLRTLIERMCMSYMDQAAFAGAGDIQELSFDEVERVDGGVLSAAATVGYTLIGVVAIATGAAPCVLAGTFLLTMTGILATS